MVRLQRIPLFPLNLVLFPGVPLPLHIFEPRYRRLIKQSIADRDEFGILLHDGTKLADAGCSAIVEGIIREYEDGRFDVLIKGQRRFRVRRIFEDQSLLEAEVEFYTDNEPATEDRMGLKELSRRAAEELMSLAALEEFSVDGELLLNQTPSDLSMMISGTELFDMTEKQDLLELTDATMRIEQNIQRIEMRLKRRRAEKKIEDLLGAPIDFKSLVN